MRGHTLAGVFLAMLVPVLSVASPIFADVAFSSRPDDGDGQFNAGGASGYDGLEDIIRVNGVPIDTVVCESGVCSELRVSSLTWAVGPLLSYDGGGPELPDGAGTYMYGAGVLTVNGSWNGLPQPELLVASIESLVIELGSEGSFGLVGTTRATLGSGVLAPLLAALLHATHMVEGSYGIDTDGAYFDEFGNGYGLGDNHGPGLDIGVEVPEPSTLILLAAGLLAGTARISAARSR